MKPPYVHYIKTSVIAVAIVYGIGNLLYALATTPDQSKMPEIPRLHTNQQNHQNH